MLDVDFTDLSFEELQEYVDKMTDILMNDKKYYVVNYFPVTNLDNRACLKMYMNEVKYFRKDLLKNGFDVEVVQLKDKKSMCFVYVLRSGVDVNPLALVDLYSSFNVIR